TTRLRSDVDPDAAGADNRHPLPYHDCSGQYVAVTDHLAMACAGEGHRAWGDAGGQHHVIETRQRGGVGPRAQAQFDPGAAEAVIEIAHGFVELLLARDPAGEVELPADGVGGLEQGDPVPTLGGDGRTGQPRRAGTDHRDAPWRRAGQVDQLGLVAGARVDQATGRAVLEDMVQTGLVAGDAGVDLDRPRLARLGHP